MIHLLALQPEKTSLNQPENELSTPDDGVRVDYDGDEESAADLTNPENAPNPAEVQGNSAEALLPASEPLRSETTASQQPTNDRRYAQPDANHTYHIVVGSFKDTDNARNYVARLQQQGYTPSLLDRPETMQAVSIGSFESPAEAEKVRKNLSDHFPDAWILHR